MKNKIIIIAILLAPILLSAQNDSMRHNGPEIVFDETSFDFDTIAQNGSGEHVFYFTNKGSEPLIITSAFSSCGCVVPEWPKSPIPPNGRNHVKINYNTNKTGSFTKAIVVKSNSVTDKKAVLRIKGVVVEPKEISSK